MQNIDNILNKFTYHFKKVLINAQNLAFARQHNEIEPDDILSSLVATKGSLGSDILIKQKIKINLNDIKISSDQKISNDPSTLPQPSKNTQNIIEKAVVTAYKFQHKYIGTEHLLWGIIESEDKKLKKILAESKINTTTLQQHLKLILKSTSKFSDIASPADEDLKEIENVFDDIVVEKNILENFTINLTTSEAQIDIDPVIGRAKELDRLIEILSRRTKNNPVLLGDAGVGKTAIIEGLAKRITENKVPDVLLNKSILNLDISSLLAGTMYRGEFESRLKQIISEIKNNPNIIIFIDELHTIMGAGATTGSLDAANILKPALARGHLRCIGATTFEEYKKHIESDKALERRFQPVMVHESSESESHEILYGIKENYEKFHNVLISDQAIRSAVVLSSRFITDKKLPDKAIDLIDEAAARFKVRKTKKSLAKQLKELQDKVQLAKNNKQKAILDENYLQALEYKNLEKKYADEFTKLQSLEKNNKEKSLGSIEEEHIREIVSEITGVPLSSIEDNQNKKLLQLEKNIQKDIFGQDKAIKTISNTIRQAKAGLHDKNKPLASFMLLGPSGVGKTATAKAIAENVFGGQKNLIRIDMSEFSEKFNISKLIGAPAGYVGYKEGNKFTDLVKNKPYSIILFDEIEKAHKDVFNLLLPILEEGELTDATGRTVNFRNCIIAMTSNIGLEEFNQKALVGFNTESSIAEKKFHDLSKKIIKSLSKYFPTEFYNRIDNILVFEPLDKKTARKIIKKEIEGLSTRLLEQNIKINIDNKIISQLLKDTEATKEGARSLKRLVDKELASPVAEIILAKSKKNIKVSLLKNKITIQ